LVTFGPDGIYGHYDHIAVHRWASIAYELAADPDCFPGRIDPTCAPHQVSKLYYHVLTEQHVDSLGEGQRPAAVQMDGVPFRFLSYQGERITTVIDIRPYAEIKLRGIRCHATQVGRNSRFGPGTAVSTAAPWTQTETFILAQSTLDRPEGIETDLFAGMR
jgi:N-acetyl-1-D-myo-inositol-2-amino-2-deoxy-alpha-D-glucopyranoside deacetylase